jgi:hypothetical protein
MSSTVGRGQSPGGRDSHPAIFPLPVPIMLLISSKLTSLVYSRTRCGGLSPLPIARPERSASLNQDGDYKK